MIFQGIELTAYLNDSIIHPHGWSLTWSYFNIVISPYYPSINGSLGQHDFYLLFVHFLMDHI
ncbi:hypothetical protein [Cytobacillus praedii]|uniref:hypothetical protein n=1 Tax=Cytobacillus praedii TaxID=1742358 RepID=UPI002E1E3557|nr:hypothetical protein [Cytobacillus praedii]